MNKNCQKYIQFGIRNCLAKANRRKNKNFRKCSVSLSILFRDFLLSCDTFDFFNPSLLVFSMYFLLVLYIIIIIFNFNFNCVALLSKNCLLPYQNNFVAPTLLTSALSVLSFLQWFALTSNLESKSIMVFYKPSSFVCPHAQPAVAPLHRRRCFLVFCLRRYFWFFKLLISKSKLQHNLIRLGFKLIVS